MSSDRTEANDVKADCRGAKTDASTVTRRKCTCLYYTHVEYWFYDYETRSTKETLTASMYDSVKQRFPSINGILLSLMRRKSESEYVLDALFVQHGDRRDGNSCVGIEKIDANSTQPDT
jgi:hypothetical protein